MEQLISILVDLFRSRQIQFDDKTGGIGRATIAQQPHLYETVINAFVNVAFGELGKSGHVGLSTFAENILRSCHEAAIADPPTQGRGNTSVITGRLPILRDEDVQRLTVFVRADPGERSQEEAQQFGIMAAAAALVEMAGAVRTPLINSQELIKPEGILLVSSMARYSASKANLLNKPIIDRQLREEVSGLEAHVQNSRASFEKEAMDQRMRLDVLAAAATDIDDKSQKAISGLDEFRESLSRHENAIREEWKLDRARLNWNDRFKEARIGFFISCGILTSFLAVTVLVAIFAGPSIVASVNHFDLALFLSGGSFGLAIAHQLGRLIVFSVPIVVYLWMLKAVMRFFMRSMLLMDDARQRETMLDTYFLLTEKGRADERDRPLILWALFRQTPGHGPDGIEPPDFTEVINAGFNRAKAVAGQ